MRVALERGVEGDAKPLVNNGAGLNKTVRAAMSTGTLSPDDGRIDRLAR
jgi:hypothetical protein